MGLRVGMTERDDAARNVEREVTTAGSILYKHLNRRHDEAIQEMLGNEGIRILDQTRLERITEKGIEVSDANGGKYELPCDTLLLSFGVRPKKDAATAFEGCAADVIKVGDCGSRQATLWNATKTGFDAAMSIV